MFKCKCFDWVARHYIVFIAISISLARSLNSIFSHIHFTRATRVCQCSVFEMLFHLPFSSFLSLALCLCALTAAIISEHWLNLRCVYRYHFHRLNCKLQRYRIVASIPLFDAMHLRNYIEIKFKCDWDTNP